MATTDSITGVTVNTTPTESGKNRDHNRGHRGLAALIAGLLGCGLLALGVPRLAAGLLTANGQDILWEIAAGRKPDREKMAAAIESRAAAHRWEPVAEREGERGTLLIRLAETLPPGAERQRILDEATAALESGLALGPVQPLSWASLAALRAEAGDRPGAVAALRLSLLAGVFDPDLMLWRINLGLSLLPAMEPETEALLAGQIRKIWVLAPDKVAQMSGDPASGPFVRRALDGLSEAEVADYLRRHGHK